MPAYAGNGKVVCYFPAIRDLALGAEAFGGPPIQASQAEFRSLLVHMNSFAVFQEPVSCRLGSSLACHR